MGPIMRSERWFLRGLIHDVAHEHEKVEECMRRAVELDPDRADAWCLVCTGPFCPEV